MAGKKGQQRDFCRSDVVYYIFIDLCNGMTRRDIREKLAQDGYEGNHTAKLCKTAVYGLLHDALELFKEEREAEMSHMRDLFYGRLMALYQVSLDAGDRTNALGCLKEIAKFADLYPRDSKNIEVQSNGPVAIKFGFSNNEDANG